MTKTWSTQINSLNKLKQNKTKKTLNTQKTKIMASSPMDAMIHDIQSSWPISSVQFSSVAQPGPTLWDPMDCSMPGFPVHHQLPGLTQTHIHWVGDVIQPSHPLCPLLLPPSIFSPSIRVFSKESVLPIRWPKCWSFSFSSSPSDEYSGLIPLGWTGLISLQSKGLSRVFSNTTVQKHQFFGAQLSWLLEKP